MGKIFNQVNTRTPPPSRPSIIMSGPHFSKALHKLQHYGVTGKTNFECIKSWLCHRLQRVVLDGSTSPDSDVLSGVTGNSHWTTDVSALR